MFKPASMIWLVPVAVFWYEPPKSTPATFMPALRSLSESKMSSPAMLTGPISVLAPISVDFPAPDGLYAETVTPATVVDAFIPISPSTLPSLRSIEEIDVSRYKSPTVPVSSTFAVTEPASEFIPTTTSSSCVYVPESVAVPSYVPETETPDCVTASASANAANGIDNKAVLTIAVLNKVFIILL